MTRQALLMVVLVSAACAPSARLPVEAGMGANPQLPPPTKSLLPTVKVADAKGWPANVTPTPARGLAANAFARDLDHPRWLYVLPNGDVLVSETNAPKRPRDNTGIRGWFFKKFAKKAGGAVPSANRITLLRDVNNDGVAEVKTAFLERLNSPFGIALVGDDLYVANTDAVMVYGYSQGTTTITGAARKLVALPAGERNHHWTKNVIASPDGAKLYVTVGSNSNAAEHGMEEEVGRAAIWQVDRNTGAHRVYASGLRNPVGMTWQASTLWTAVNERDELGSDLVPDYMTSVQDGGFYGWPYSYYGAHVDDRVKPPRSDLVARAIIPDYALGSHTGSLGLTSAAGSRLPAPFTDGMFIGQHGSWNRNPRSGYRVIFVPFQNGTPAGDAVEVLTGFLDDDHNARGRPVGVAMDRQGALLVADDVGNVIWRVTRAR
jgi:glucose/arabinose dehydrogenase